MSLLSRKTNKIVHPPLYINPLSANFTKWSNTLKQFIGLALKGFAMQVLNSHIPRSSLAYSYIANSYSANILTTKLVRQQKV